MTKPETGSDIIVGGGTGTGYILFAVVPPRSTLLVSCNVVAISTESILRWERAVVWFYTNLKSVGISVTDQPALGEFSPSTTECIANQSGSDLAISRPTGRPWQ